MSESLSSRFKRLLITTGLPLALFNSLAYAAETPEKCITPPTSAMGFGICRLQKINQLRAAPTQLSKASQAADRLNQAGLSAMKTGNYGEAKLNFSTANVWLPSYTSMIGTGDAYFSALASGAPSDTDPTPDNCSSYFLENAAVELQQTYDAALAMHTLANSDTDEMPAALLAKTELKSNCLHALLESEEQRYSACTPRRKIQSCLAPH